MLRNLFKSDLVDILTIEKSVHIAPWTEETFKTCFEVGYQGWVIEADKKILGFIIVSLTKEECHILNLCIHLKHQRQGLGSKLLQHALNYAKQQGLHVAYLEVRKSNSRAITLYRKMNFHLIAERKEYYPSVSGYEDALIFAKNLRQEAT